MSSTSSVSLARRLIFSFRHWSWLFAATIVVPVAYFIYQNRVFSTWAKERARNGEFVCGTGLAVLLGACFVLICLLWAVASTLGLIGYMRIEKPRPKGRLRELWLVVSTLIVAIVLMAAGLFLS
jgi:hypothetical protein